MGWVASRDKLRLRQRIPEYVRVTQACPHALA